MSLPRLPLRSAFDPRRPAAGRGAARRSLPGRGAVRSRRRSAWLAFLALGALLLGACGGEPPLRFSVTFQDANGLEAGDEVRYKGLEIGRVTDVDVDPDGNVRAQVLIEPKYRSSLAANSVIEIERAGLLGGRQLSVRDGSGERRQLAEGDSLTGSEGRVSDALSQLREAGRAAFEGARQLGADLQQRLRDFPDSPEARDLSDALTRFRDESVEAGKKGSEWVREDGVEAVRQKAETLRRKLEQEGKSEEARELLQRMESWLREIRRGEGDSKE